MGIACQRLALHHTPSRIGDDCFQWQRLCQGLPVKAAHQDAEMQGFARHVHAPLREDGGDQPC